MYKKMVLLFRDRSSIAAPMNINEFPKKTRDRGVESIGKRI
jgi:hypothetical protein